MREIAEHHDRRVIEAFAAWLSSTGVACEVVAAGSRWRLAVDERDARAAALAYARFLHEPSHPARHALGQARPAGPTTKPWLTWLLLATSVAVALLTRLGEDPAMISLFAFADLLRAGGLHDRTFADIRHGEVWRLVTPLFLHFGWLHLLMNAQAFLALGPPLERVIGTARFAALVLALTVASNIAQAQFGGSNAFGGLSGMLYGLFGYLWLRGRRDRSWPLRIPARNLVLPLLWFVACFAGVFGPIGNWSHASGLVLGAALGWIAGGRRESDTA